MRSHTPVGSHSDGRLSSFDGSFLRLESGSHVTIHMGFSTLFAVPSDRPRPSVEALRERAASRLHELPWVRWKLDTAPLGLTEPRWIADTKFDLRAHIIALTAPEDRVSEESFEALCGMFFSMPLDRTRPMWQFALVPRLHDGRVALVGKVHHSLVDGVGAMQFARLVFDTQPYPDVPAPPMAAGPRDPGTHPGPLGWAVDTITQNLAAGVGALREAPTTLAHPRAAVGRLLRKARLIAGTVREDALPPSPPSGLNGTIGPRRALVCYAPQREDLLAARANGGTINDVGLAIVAGALRELAVRQHESLDEPLKAMIPVNLRQVGDTASGNRFAIVRMSLPTHLASPRARLEHVRDEMRLLKHGHRTEAAAALMGTTAFLPAPLRTPLIRAMGRPRQFNIMVSNPPTPRGSIYLLGCELEQYYTAIPLTEGHLLAVGLSRYSRGMFIACHADPHALPEVYDLPALMEADLRALASAASPVVREARATAARR